MSKEQWDKYIDTSGATSHDYDHQKASIGMMILIDDAIGLYQTMTSQTWESKCLIYHH